MESSRSSGRTGAPIVLRGARASGNRRPALRSPYDPHTGMIWARLPLPAWNSWAAEAVDAPLVWRLWALAAGRVGSNGHAPFQPGELVLANRHGVVYGDRAVQQSINKLKEWGLVAPSSSRRCLVLPSDYIDHTLRSGGRCPACLTDKRWTWRHGGSWAGSDAYD